MSTPPRILFVAANPNRDISTEDEFRRVRKVLAKVPGIDLQPALCATIDDLQDELIERDFDFVHLASHGAQNTATLEDAGDIWGEDIPVSIVIDLLREHASLKCVVLNACHSASWITAPLGPAMVTMRGRVGDAAALDFSEAFYRCIAAERPVAYAFQQGKLRAERKHPGAEFQPELWPECTGVIGIRTQRRFQKDSHIRCQFFCDLEAYFPNDGDVDWTGAAAALTQSLESDELRARFNLQECHLNLDCPMALALVAGRVLGAHANVYPLQSRPVRELWKPDNSLPMPTTSPWQLTEHSSVGARKLVVSISIAQNTRPLVAAHLEKIGDPVHWVDFCPVGGASPHAIHDANHANALARVLAQELQRLRAQHRYEQVDLFFAAPNAFMFLLGQQGASLGTLNLHHKVHGEDRYVTSFCSK